MLHRLTLDFPFGGTGTLQVLFRHRGRARRGPIGERFRRAPAFRLSPAGGSSWRGVISSASCHTYAGVSGRRHYFPAKLAGLLVQKGAGKRPLLAATPDDLTMYERQNVGWLPFGRPLNNAGGPSRRRLASQWSRRRHLDGCRSQKDPALQSSRLPPKSPTLLPDGFIPHLRSDFSPKLGLQVQTTGPFT